MNIQNKIKIAAFFTVSFLVLWLAPSAKAASVGDVVNFNVDSGYDAQARLQVPATLVKITPSLYFYVQTDWWTAQSGAKQIDILTQLESLSSEFSSHIYPALTSQFGFDSRPGIDNDAHIGVLFEAMKEPNAGYFRQNDQYPKLQVPDSNERDMAYLSLSLLSTPSQMKVVLAHEFMHLIIFNQKNKLRGVQEETWLDEARSDYTSTFLGYDDAYEGSNLQARVKDFLASPSDSVPEFLNTKYDFASAHLFAEYLVERYGIGVLSDSLQSNSVGIESINAALAKNGYREDFAQVFTNWTIALAVNNCAIDSHYCYTSANLSNLRINPTLLFLPLSGNSSLSINNVTKNWAPNWQKIIGGSGDLTLQFSSLTGLNFKVPYITYDKGNNATVKFLALDSKSKGQISIKDFGSQYNSLVIIPTLQTKTSGFSGAELAYPYTFTITIAGNLPQEDPALIQQLLDKIQSLQKQIAALRSVNGGQSTPSSVCQLSIDLRVGSSGSQVTCLQKFLTAQGPAIYPQGLVTGYFGALTKAAVVRFQEKYKAEILLPLGLSRGTGFVGAATRQKINSLL